MIKRVTEFEDYSTCWPDDRLKAMGLVGQVRHVRDVKDSFTRINLEREKERTQRLAQKEAEEATLREKRAALASVRVDLTRLFALSDPQKKGKALEKVLNDFFKTSGISVKEAFTLTGETDEGIIEQIDGVVELDGQIYLVEMKWWNQPIGKPEVSQSLVGIYHRGQSRGIIISASGYSEPALAVCKEALQKTVVVLCTLEEIVLLLEREADLKQFLKEKVNAAIVYKKPFYEALKNGVA